MTRTLYLTRSLGMGAAGLLCLGYAIAALATGRPDPVPFWLPGVLGGLAWLAVSLVAARASAAARAAAFDEGYRHDDTRAQQLGFWVAIWLYPLFGVLLYVDAVTWPVAFAAMGTLTAATYLLGVVWFDSRGRA